MGTRYSIADARSNLSTIVDQAEAGQKIELTRRGATVAVVISLWEYARLRGARTPFGDAYKHFLSMHALDDIGLEPGVLAASRAKGSGRTVERPNA